MAGGVSVARWLKWKLSIRLKLKHIIIIIISSSISISIAGITFRINSKLASVLVLRVI